MRSWLASAFAAHGERLARHPLVFIVPVVLAAAVMSAGISHITVDSDPNTVWVPPTATTAQQKQYFDSAFDPFFRVNQLIIAMDTDACAGGGEGVSLAPVRAHGSREGVSPARRSVYTGGGGGGAWLAGGTTSIVARAPAPGCGGNFTSPASGLLTRDALLAVLDLQTRMATAADSAGTVLDDICFKVRRGAAGRGGEG